MFARLMAGQFRKPRGFLGRIVGNMMARGNEYEAAWTVSMLNIQAADHVVEVGFGPGVAIQLVAEKATSGLAAGIELSPTMVDLARKRNAAAVRTGRVELRQGDVASLPYGGGSFDKAFAIHNIYFWPKPGEALTELRRVLKPNGMLAITILPKDKWDRTPPADVFSLYDADAIEHLLIGCEFREVRTELSPQPEKFAGVCVHAVK